MAKLKIEVDGKKLTVERAHYVTAKTKQLREFGYNNITEEAVDSQITKVLAKKPLDIIGKFIEGEVITIAQQ